MNKILQIMTELSSLPHVLSKRDEDRKERGRISDQRYYQRHKERIIKRNLEYRQRNPEQRKTSDAAYRKVSGAIINARHRAWRKKNKKHCLEYHRKYSKDWYAMNPQKRKQYRITQWLKEDK